MTRTVRESTAAPLEYLRQYAISRGTNVPSGERFVFVDEPTYERLAQCRTEVSFPIARRQSAGIITRNGVEHIVLVGFEAENLSFGSQIREVDRPDEIAIAALADLSVEPSASAIEIYNVVGAGSRSDPDYAGHRIDEIAPLYPKLRILEVDVEVAGTSNFLSNILILCATEAVEANGWINSQLAEALRDLGGLRIAGLPYQSLVMAALGLDPRELYLALYRCLEATYAFKNSTDLAEKLSLQDKSWLDVAKAVGESLGWYPRHDQALTAVLELPGVRADDLRKIARCLAKDEDGDGLAARVSTGIRELRNRLVHYGPTSQPANVRDDDWNALCTPLARVVADVFSHTYGGLAAPHLESGGDTATNQAVKSVGLVNLRRLLRRVPRMKRLL